MDEIETSMPVEERSRWSVRLGQLRLRFRDPGLEKAYRADRFRHDLGNIRFGFLAGIAIWVAWGVLLRPQMLALSDQRLDLLMRFGVFIPILIVGLALTYTRFFGRVWEWVAVAIAAATLLFWVFYVSRISTLPAEYGYVGVILITAFTYALLRLRFVLVALVTVIGIANVVLLYRRIGSLARITVSLWIGTLITVVAVIVTGALHFDAARAFDFPPGAFNFSLGFFLGLGAASRVGIYDYLGYYDICYIGDEVRDPGRVIPRSILISTAAVALIYIGINLSIIGVVPWREFVPASAHPESGFIVSVFMQRIYGSKVATAFTLLVLWTAFGSVFALLLGYSRIPFAAATSGYFFRAFGRLHPTKGFPHVSLIVLGAISIVAGFFSLGTVIDAMIVTRIVVQFMGQIVGLMLLRRRAPDMPRPYKMWLYPVPALVALFGWIFLFATTQPRVILFGVGVLVLGCLAFVLWSRRMAGTPSLAAGD